LPEPAVRSGFGATGSRADAASIRDALGSVAAGGSHESTAREVWRTLGRAGVLAELYPTPTSADRLGVRPRHDPLRDLLTELDSRYPTGVVLAVCVQVATAVPVLSSAVANPVVRAAYEAALAGETVVSLAATDAATAGSDLVNLGTRLDLTDDSVTVTGGKRWITNAVTADWHLVLGRHRPQPHFTSLAWALVPAGAPGVTARPAGTDMFGGSGVGHLDFDGVVLDRSHVVGAPGRGLAVFGRHVTTERLAGAQWGSARARRVLVETRHHLQRRRLGGRPLWENEAVRERFARCLLEWWRLDGLAARFADALDAPQSLATSMLLKSAVAEGLDAVLAGCLQLHGASGFTEHGLAQVRAESVMFGIAGGATEAMLAGVADGADQLLGVPPAPIVEPGPPAGVLRSGPLGDPRPVVAAPAAGGVAR
jgi:citronellyl-CoA dehydrogenase